MGIRHGMGNSGDWVRFLGSSRFEAPVISLKKTLTDFWLSTPPPQKKKTKTGH